MTPEDTSRPLTPDLDAARKRFNRGVETRRYEREGKTPPPPNTRSVTRTKTTTRSSSGKEVTITVISPPPSIEPVLTTPSLRVARRVQVLHHRGHPPHVIARDTGLSEASVAAILARGGKR